MIERCSNEISELTADAVLDAPPNNPATGSGDNKCEPEDAECYKPKKKFLVDAMFPRANRNEGLELHPRKNRLKTDLF
jgi:hypothetical protein